MSVGSGRGQFGARQQQIGQRAEQARAIDERDVDRRQQ
jgi:hypothetical protein